MYGGICGTVLFYSLGRQFQKWSVLDQLAFSSLEMSALLLQLWLGFSILQFISDNVDIVLIHYLEGSDEKLKCGFPKPTHFPQLLQIEIWPLCYKIFEKEFERLLDRN